MKPHAATYIFLIALSLLTLALGACGGAPAAPEVISAQPSGTTVETPPLPTPTSTPAIGWQGTSLPHLSGSIAYENADGIEEIARWKAPVWSERAILQVAYSPDGARFAIVAPDGIYLYDAKTLGLIKLLDQPAYHVIFSPDGKSLAMAIWENQKVELWNIEDDEEIRSFSRTDVANDVERNYVTSLTFSPDGKILSASFIDAVKLWNVEDGQELHALKQNFACGGGDGCAALTGAERAFFSPDGKTLLVLNAADREIQWWAVGEWKLLNTLPVELFSRNTPLFVADSTGARFAVSSPGISLYDTQTLKKIMHIGPSGKSIAFSPDGKIFVFGYQDLRRRTNTMEFFDALNGGKLYTLNMPAAVENIAFSPDGNILATALSDGTIRLWGVKS